MLATIANAVKRIINEVSFEIHVVPSDQAGLDIEIREARYIYSYAHEAWFDSSELTIIATCDFLEAAIHIPSGCILLSHECEWEDGYKVDAVVTEKSTFPGFSKSNDYLKYASGAL